MEHEHGYAIAHRAKQMYKDRGDYYIWGYQEGESVGYPPPPAEPQTGPWNLSDGTGVDNISEQTSGGIPLVCADVPLLILNDLGSDLLDGNWGYGSNYDQMNAGRSTSNLLSNASKVKNGTGFVEIGDTVITGTGADGHAAVVVDVDGDRSDPGKVWVVQTSGTERSLSYITLADMMSRLGVSSSDIQLLQFNLP